jgi:signal transduction histidine kinase
MISKILDFDALEGNRMKIMTEQIKVKDLLNTLKNDLEVTADKKGIKITFQANSDLTLNSDHLFLTKIFENIIVNAIKFSKRSSEVFVEVRDLGHKVLFSIRDQGPGFTEEDKALIFKKFQKLSAQPTGGENSTGLGLSILKKYVDLLKGEVWVESEEGKGSTFFITLPK